MRTEIDDVYVMNAVCFTCILALSTLSNDG